MNKEELKAINEILQNQEILKFVEDNQITNEEILSNFGKFLYVYQNEEFTLYKDTIINIVKKQENQNSLNYLFAPQNEQIIFNIDKHDIWGEHKISILQKFIKEKSSFKGMYIYGEVGSGKTFLTMMMVKKLISEKKYCAYLSMYQYIRFVLDNKDRSFINSTLNSNYLFLDDLGAQSVTNFYLQELFFIIDYRYKLKLPTYYTSNFTLQELFDKFATVDQIQAKRIVSRIKDCSYAIKL